MKQFMTAKEAAKELGLCRDTVKAMIEGVEQRTPERYNKSDIFDGHIKAVRFVALQDLKAIESYEKAGVEPPPYEPIKREKELGILPMSELEQPGLDMDLLAEKVANRLLSKLISTLSAGNMGAL